MSWNPTAQEIEEKLIEMAYVWGDIEAELFSRGPDDIAFTPEQASEKKAFEEAHAAVEAAFRVEAVWGENHFGDPCTFYVLLYDVTDREARENANDAEASSRLRAVIEQMARPWHSDDFLIVKRVAKSTPVEGQICRRSGEEHPASKSPSLDDAPTFIPDGSTVPFERRGPYYLTPIEVPVYDALAETGLTFSVQPWIQHADTKYRVDFLVYYDGGAVAVELDGHEFHKTKEQRGADAMKDRWLQARAIRVVRFTGSQVFANVQGCIRELLDVLRQSQARL